LAIADWRHKFEDGTTKDCVSPLVEDSSEEAGDTLSLVSEICRPRLAADVSTQFVFIPHGLYEILEDVVYRDWLQRQV